MTPKQHGLEKGYRDDRFNRHVLPPCPYGLYAEDDDGRQIRPKIRNPDRDEWLSGWMLGRALRKQHETELAKALETWEWQKSD